MDHKELYEKLYQYRVISGDWRHLVKLVWEILQTEAKKEELIKLFIAHFLRTDDGHVYTPLEVADYEAWINAKRDSILTPYEEDDEEEENAVRKEKRATARKELEAVFSELRNASKALADISEVPIVRDRQMFDVSGNRLYSRKNSDAVIEIVTRTEELFQSTFTTTASVPTSSDYKDDFKLEMAQEQIVLDGLRKNLLVTGGPGTGKTTSIFFLLIALLKANPNYNVYMAAPSGKAAERMKESVTKNVGNLSPQGKQSYAAELTKIEALKEYTIHRLLGAGHEGFKFHKGNQFPEDSIFIIDEASMIDVTLFASLLSAIPDKARVFILGDKNQLPSVECGAVYGDLLDLFPNNVVTLTVSRRFKAGSSIYKLAEAVNSGITKCLPDISWKPSTDFEIGADSESDFPIYYYTDTVAAGNRISGKAMAARLVEKWGNQFYKDYKNLCRDLTEEDNNRFVTIFGKTEEARILCACNDGIRGNRSINRQMVKALLEPKPQAGVHYPGEIVMVTRNLKTLDLYNGDSGVAVKFKGDSTLYYMFKKKTALKADTTTVYNHIFQLGEFVFYPANQIGNEDIDTAFAISIHKSQGSDYGSIAVVLPNNVNHPLLNRQIVYTAITRTKGRTYLFSGQEALEHATETVEKRDTLR